MKIDDALIGRLATLAKLEFSDQEVEQVKGDMERMLDLVDTLNEVDTTGVEPLLYITNEVNRLRPDVITATTTQAEALQNAPSKDGYYIKVPKVIVEGT